MDFYEILDQVIDLLQLPPTTTTTTLPSWRLGSPVLLYRY